MRGELLMNYEYDWYDDIDELRDAAERFIWLSPPEIIIKMKTEFLHLNIAFKTTAVKCSYGYAYLSRPKY